MYVYPLEMNEAHKLTNQIVRVLKSEFKCFKKFSRSDLDYFRGLIETDLVLHRRREVKEKSTKEQIMLDYIKIKFPQVYDKAEKEAGMLKVADRVYNGSYVARITGSDPKFGLKREFLETDRKFSKEKGEFTMSLKDRAEIAEGDIIALKLVKKGQTKKDAKENFYKIVKTDFTEQELKTLAEKGRAGGAIELHDMVAKISLDEVKKIFPQKETAEKKSPDRVSEGLDR